MELQADAEHQENHPNFGELVGDLLVGDEAGRVRSHEEPSEQVSDNGGQPESKAHVAARERGGQSASQGHDEIEVVHDSGWRIRVGDTPLECRPMGA